LPATPIEPTIEKPIEQGKPDYASISKKLSELKVLPDKENYINELLEKNKEDMTIKYLAAIEYHKLGNLEMAEKLYRKILEKERADKRVLYSLASLMNQQKKSKEAYELYSNLMVIAPDYLNTKKYYEVLDAIYGGKQVEKNK
jgi:tetratricopeptide (TPR) repeat protein